MATEILAVAGLNPTGLVGGRVVDWESNLRFGGDDLFVVEADEYDRSFHHLRPRWPWSPIWKPTTWISTVTWKGSRRLPDLPGRGSTRWAGGGLWGRPWGLPAPPELGRAGPNLRPEPGCSGQGGMRSGRMRRAPGSPVVEDGDRQG